MAESDGGSVRPPAPRSGGDPAAQTGRVAGTVVNSLGLRLLRFRPVRRAIRRAAAAAAEQPEPAAGQEPSEAAR